MSIKFTQVYCKTATRTRLKALAWVQRKTLAEYLDSLAKQETGKLDPEMRRVAYEAVSDEVEIDG